MAFSYRIFLASSDQGGPISTNITTTLTPGVQTAPGFGMGTKYIYRKYYINILDFNETDDALALSSFSVTPHTVRSVTISYTPALSTINTSAVLEYGTSPSVFTNIVTLGDYQAGERSITNTVALLESTVYFFKLTIHGDNNTTRVVHGNFTSLDETAPIVLPRSVSISLTPTAATISWRSNENAVYRVAYAVNGTENWNYIPSVGGWTSQYNSNHSVAITGLDPETTYKYTITLKDASGNTSVHPEETFTTLSEGAPPALTITLGSVSSIGATSATVAWTTSNPSLSDIRYALSPENLWGDNAELYFTIIDSTLRSSHSIGLTSLSSETTYYYRIRAYDTHLQEKFNPVDAGAMQASFDTISGTTNPIISNVIVAPQANGTEAVFTFSTSVACTIKIYYNTAALFDQTDPNPYVTGTSNTSHNITISGMTPSTLMKYRIEATATVGGLVSLYPAATDGTGYTFTTSPGDLTVSNVNVSSTENLIRIDFSTSQAQCSIVPPLQYRLTGGGAWSPPPMALTSSNGYNHYAEWRGLEPNTSYDVRVTVRNIDNLTVTIERTASTTAPGTVVIFISAPNISVGEDYASFSFITTSAGNPIQTRYLLRHWTEADPDTIMTALSPPGVYQSSWSNVTMWTLEPDTAYGYDLECLDASSNSATVTGQFTTLPLSGGGNTTFAPGDTVTTVEYEVASNYDAGATVPIRAVVPVRSNDDLSLDWRVNSAAGVYVQREITKSADDGTPYLVEIVFPYVIPSTSVAGDILNIPIYATTIPRGSFFIWPTSNVDLVVNMTIGVEGAVNSTTSIKETANGVYDVLRGAGSIGPYMRTIRYNTACTSSIDANLHPETKSIGVISYVTEFNSNYFPNFKCSAVDLKLHNAFIDPERLPQLGGPGWDAGWQGDRTARGHIHYRTISVDSIIVGSNPTHKVVPDYIQHGMTDYASEGSGKFLLVKKLKDMSPHRRPNGSGNDIPDYNLLYGAIQGTGPDGDHAFIAGSTLEFRLGIFPYGGDTSALKERAQKLARCEYVGYTKYVDNRQLCWENCPSFGPTLVRLANILDGDLVYNGASGNKAVDKMYREAHPTLVSSLADGTWTVSYNSPILGEENYVNGRPHTFGPYAIVGGHYAGVGGADIGPYIGSNHSKYQVMAMIIWNKLNRNRMFYNMFNRTTGNILSYKDLIKPSQVNLVMKDGTEFDKFTTVGGFYTDAAAPLWFEETYSYLSSQTNVTLPWNKPSYPWGTGDGNSPTLPSPSHSCYYITRYDTRPGPVYSGYGSGLPVQSVYMNAYNSQIAQGGYHRFRSYTRPYDHAHQIRFSGYPIALAEIINDLLAKDDLLMLAAYNQYAYCPYPKDSSYAGGPNAYTNGYNLAEIYHGWGNNDGCGPTRGGYQKGTEFGRQKGWPIWAIIAAYMNSTLRHSNNKYRDDTIITLRLWAKIARDARQTVTKILHSGRTPVTGGGTGNLEHPGQFTDGVYAVLVPEESITINGETYGSLQAQVNVQETNIQTVAVINGLHNTKIKQFVMPIPGGESDGACLRSYSRYRYPWHDGRHYLRYTKNSDLNSWKPTIICKFEGPGSAELSIRYGYFDDNLNKVHIAESQVSFSAPIPGTFAAMNWVVPQRDNSFPHTESTAGPEFGVRIWSPPSVVLFDKHPAWESFNPVYRGLDASTPGYGGSAWMELWANFREGSVQGASVVTVKYKYTSANDLTLPHTGETFVRTTIDDVRRMRYDIAQMFETHITHHALIGMSNVLKRSSDTLLGASVEGGILGFYEAIYNNQSVLPTTDITQQTLNSSSTWRYGNSVYDSWMLPSRRSVFHKDGWGPLDSYADREGAWVCNIEYGNDNSDHYSYFSTLGNHLCRMPPLDIEDLTYQPFKWFMALCGANSESLAEKIRLMFGYTPPPGVGMTATPYAFTQRQAYGMTVWYALLKWNENNSGVRFENEPPPSVRRLRLSLSKTSSPTSVEFGATSNFDDSISGPTEVVGDQSNVGLDVNFRSSKGESQATLLYGNDGEQGGDVTVGYDANNSVPFWIRYKIPANTTLSGSHYTVAVTAGEGETAGGGEPPTDSNSYYSNADNDKYIFTSAQAAGNTSVSQVGSTYTFEYVSNDQTETITYNLNTGDINGNQKGLLRIYESGSNSYPVYNGGLRYLSGTTYLEPVQVSQFTSAPSGALDNGSKSLTLYYKDTINGVERNKRYVVGITGKSLRVKLESNDASPYQWGSGYAGATLGIATGCWSGVVVEYNGGYSTQTVLFKKEATSDQFYWSRFVDASQSNSQRLTWPVPSGIVPTLTAITNFDATITYKRSNQSTFVSPVSETFNVGVFNNIEDALPTSTAKPSPYYNTAKKYAHMLCGALPRGRTYGDLDINWTQAGNLSYYTELEKITSWGLTGIHYFPFQPWSSVQYYLTQEDYTGNHSAIWMPATGSNFGNLSNFCRDLTVGGYASSNIFSPYIRFANIKSGQTIDSDSNKNFDQNNIAKTLAPYTDHYTLNSSVIEDIAVSQVLSMKSNYGAVGIHWDIDTYGADCIRGENLDQVIGSNKTMTVKESIKDFKYAFDRMRIVTQLPMLGEGTNFFHWMDQPYIYYGWHDTEYRAYCVGKNEGFGESFQEPAARYPTRSWIIPHYEQHVFKTKKAGAGHAIEGLLLHPHVDGDVWDGTFPKGRGYHERERAFNFTHCRRPSTTTNGFTQTGLNNYYKNQNLITHYYMGMAVTDRQYNANISNISYYLGGNWSGFNEAFKASRSLLTFTGVMLRLEYDDSTKVFINHSSTPYTSTVDNLTYTLAKDGVMAYNLQTNKEFIAFTAAASGIFNGIISGDTNSNKINYLYDPGRWELFDGRQTACSGFGNIMTSGRNTSEVKVLNYTLGKTIYNETGVPSLSEEVYVLNYIDNYTPSEPEPPEEPVINYNLVPENDKNVYLSANAGNNSVQQLNEVGGDTNFIFRYINPTTLESIQYSLNASTTATSRGLIRIYESTSNCWPVYNGGFVYKKNAVTIQPENLTGYLSIKGSVTKSPDDIVSATLTGNYEGTPFSGMYSIQITGKQLRINLKSLSPELTSYNDSIISANIGKASGCYNAKVVEYPGGGCVPTVLFSGQNTSKQFYWSAVPDYTQSNAQQIHLSDPVGKTFSNEVISHHPTAAYSQNSDGKIVATVDETFNVGVFNSLKDALVTSTVPSVPYRQDSIGRYYLLGADRKNNPDWIAPGQGSYLTESVNLDYWGITGRYFWLWYWTSVRGPNRFGEPAGDNDSVIWSPATGTNFRELVTNVKVNNKCGVYGMFHTVYSGQAYDFPQIYGSYNQAGNIKTYNPLLGLFNLNPKFYPGTSYNEVSVLTGLYGINGFHWDVDTYSYRMLDDLDQTSGTSKAKTIRDSIIYKKKGFDSVRIALGGQPLIGEGTPAGANDDMEWLYFGYVNSSHRSLVTNLTYALDQNNPATPLSRYPTRYPIIPHWEQYVFKNYIIGQGQSMLGRFFNHKTDDDVARYHDESASGVSGFFPLTRGAFERLRTHNFTYCRAGLSATNGYFAQGTAGNYHHNEDLIVDNYIMNAVSSRQYNTNISDIKYRYNGFFYNFDTIFKATRTLNSFTGRIVELKYEDGLNIVVNHSNIVYTTGVNQFSCTLDKDSFVAWNTGDGFIAFTAAASGNWPGVGSSQSSNNGKITYMYDPNKYEVFQGREDICDQFGNITTNGANRYQMKVRNILGDFSVRSTTGATPSIIRGMIDD